MLGKNTLAEDNRFLFKTPFNKDVGLEGSDLWSTEVTTSDGTWTDVDSFAMKFGRIGRLKSFAFSATWKQKSSSTTKYVRGRVVVRKTDGTVLLTVVDDGSGNAYIQDNADASSYAIHSIEGDLTAANLATIGVVPADGFEVAIQVQREDSNENALGQAARAGFVEAVFE